MQNNIQSWIPQNQVHKSGGLLFRITKFGQRRINPLQKRALSLKDSNAVWNLKPNPNVDAKTDIHHRISSLRKAGTISSNKQNLQTCKDAIM
ncbi:hypothetical protein V6N11_039803 [Hibiscus sabdariffa]|uniref:Uncharacterized protein n=1 Tax=Hibiscus sabdariffa TaxID=183260 RepID=A0ABR2RFU2_9ROSI